MKQLFTRRPDYSVTVSYQLAVTYAYKDEVENTKIWINKCLKKNPAMLAAAEMDPAFSRIRENGFFHNHLP